MKLLVSSYNIQHGIYYPDSLQKGDRSAKLYKTADFLKEKNPDVCGINEIYGESSVFGDQPRQLAEALGCGFAFAKAVDVKNGPYGNALLTRHTVKAVRTYGIKTDPASLGEAPLYHEDRVLLSADIEAFGRRFTAMTCHFGLNEAEARAAADTVKAELTRVTSPVILMGDFNLTPDSPIIEELSQLLTDTAEGEQLTFPSTSPKSKIDYIFVRGFRVLRSYTVNAVISDHLPLFAELEME